MAVVAITIHCKFRIIIISSCISRRFTIMLVLKVLQMSLIYCQYLVWGVVLFCSYYRPQTKFGQGADFTPVCDSVHGGGVGGGCLPHCMLGYNPLGRHSPLGRHPSSLCRHPQAPRQTPLRPLGRHPLPGQTSPGRHPPTSDTTGYGQQAGGTHPIGMHTCVVFKSGGVHFFYMKTGTKTVCKC